MRPMVFEEWIMWVEHIPWDSLCYFVFVRYYLNVFMCWCRFYIKRNKKKIFDVVSVWKLGFCDFVIVLYVRFVSYALFFHRLKTIVLKRCISGLPSTECPFIPKRFIEQYQSRRTRSILLDHFDVATDENPSHHPVNSVRSPRGAANVSDLIALGQLGVEPKVQCEERRQLGQQILIEKGHHVDSMLSRFVGNFIMHFSNQTESQEVSAPTDGECQMPRIYPLNNLSPKKKCVICELVTVILRSPLSDGLVLWRSFLYVCP